MTYSPDHVASPLDEWRDAMVRPVAPEAAGHTIHSYFNISPERPDASSVLYYQSEAADGQRGELRVVDRATGAERTLVRDVVTEDAHRVAAQQWLAGHYVCYQNERSDGWHTIVVDADTGDEVVALPGWLAGWGTPTGSHVPLYGPHWNPGDNRDISLLDVHTGKLERIVRADDVASQFAEWIEAEFGSTPISLFFPILNPQATRLIFKISSVRSGVARDERASHREGLFCVELASGTITMLSPRWGHPSWHPDGRRIVQVGNVLIDSVTAGTVRLPGLGDFGSGHPSSSNDGQLLVSDTTTARFGGAAGEWGIALGSLEGGAFEWIDRFDNADGAASWRLPHPHPVFGHDDSTIYFNISAHGRTRLFEARKRKDTR